MKIFILTKQDTGAIVSNRSSSRCLRKPSTDVTPPLNVHLNKSCLDQNMKISHKFLLGHVSKFLKLYIVTTIIWLPMSIFSLQTINGGSLISWMLSLPTREYSRFILLDHVRRPCIKMHLGRHMQGCKSNLRKLKYNAAIEILISVLWIKVILQFSSHKSNSRRIYCQNAMCIIKSSR